MDRIKKLNTAKMIESIVGAAIELILAIILLVITIMTLAINRHFGIGQFLLYNGLMLLSLGVFVTFIIINSIELGRTKDIISGNTTFAFGGLSSAVALINLIENGFALKFMKGGAN